MSDRPQNGPEIEGPMREWLHAEALRGQAAPAALRERVNAIPAIAPDRTWGWLHFGSFQSVPAVAATVVIAVTLTAVGLGLVQPFLATPPDEPPIPSASVSSVAPSAPASTASSSPVSSATAEPSEVPQATWDVALMPDPAPGYRGALPADVVATDQGLVAVGGAGPCCADVSYTDPWQAFVWLSPDGAEWQVIERPEQWDKLQFRSVAWNGSQLLAIAERIGPPPADELGSGFSTSTEIWLSSDGTEWELAADGQDLGNLNHVVAGGPGWVAVGSTGADATGIGGQPAAFTSIDGREWAATSLDGVGGHLEQVAALPDGRLLAIGCEGDPDFNPEQDEASCVSRVWLSPDGRRWDRVAKLDGYVRDLAVAPDGLIVAVGSSLSGGLTAWLSIDGAAWDSTQMGGGTAYAVAMEEGLIVVAGDIIGPDGVSVSAVWTSTSTGVIWASVPLERVEGETSGSARMVVEGPGGIVVLGDAFIDGAVPVAWREPTYAPDPPQTPAPSSTGPTPTPVSYVDRAGLPFSVIESRQADTLFERSATCSNAEDGYTVSYPEDWYTNEHSAALPACSWFAPTQFEVPAQFVEDNPAPDEVVIEVGIFEGGVGQILEWPRTLSEQVPLGGRQGYRFEDRVNEEPPAYIYSYGASLDENYLGRKFAAYTRTAPGHDYHMNRAVLDRMMASLELAEQ